MFKIISNPTFAHDIDVEVPVDGGYENQKLSVRFKVLDTETLTGFDITILPGQDAYCEAIVETFEDLTDQDGKPVSCTAKIRKMLLGTPYVRAAVMSHYTRAIMGASRKN